MTLHAKLCLVKYDIDISVYNSEILLLSTVFSVKVTSAFLLHVNIKELSWWNTFEPRKTTISFTLLIRWRFQANRRESDIAVFVWNVTLNYAFSPFKWRFIWIFMDSPFRSMNLKVVCSWWWWWGYPSPFLPPAPSRRPFVQGGTVHSP